MKSRRAPGLVGDILLGVFAGFFSVGIGVAVGYTWKESVEYSKKDYYVCIDTPEQYQDRIAEAIAAWDKALSSWRHFIPVFNHEFSCDYLIQEVTVRDPAAGNTAVAWANIGGRDICLLKGEYEFDPGAVVLHEFGHANGAQHIPGTTMNPSVLPVSRNKELCADVYTVAQVAAFNKLDLEKLWWCGK